MPHHRRHYQDNSVLNKEHYEATAVTPSIDIGTYYPGCTQEDLIELDHADEWSDRFSGHWEPVSLRQATVELEDWLSKPPPHKSAAAIKRMRSALHQRSWTPDLPIKMFNDLDRAFFGRFLKGRCKLRWKGSTKALRKDIGPRYHDTAGVTMPVLNTAVPIARMILNAEVIFLDPRGGRSPEKSRKRMTYGTLMHEMVHGESSLQHLELVSGFPQSMLTTSILAYLLVRLGSCTDADETMMGRDGSHGRYFQRCIEAVERRTKKDIGYVPHWNEKHDHRGHRN